MNRLSPKALTVSNLTEAILEESRMSNVIGFNQKRQPVLQRNFSWKVLLMLLAAFGLSMFCAYQFFGGAW